jgi:hypothetical protein
MNRLARGENHDPHLERLKKYAGKEYFETEKSRREAEVASARKDLLDNISEVLRTNEMFDFEQLFRDVEGCVFCEDPVAEYKTPILLASLQWGLDVLPFRWVEYPPSAVVHANLCKKCYETAPGNIKTLPEIKIPSKILSYLEYSPDVRKIAEEVLDVLKSKRIQRLPPNSEESVLDTMVRHVDKNKPIKAFVFWGVHEKKQANWAEEKTFNNLCSIIDNVEEVYSPGIDMQILFADAHGAFNGIETENVNSYYESLFNLSKTNNFRISKLSRKIWLKYGICVAEIEFARRSQALRSEHGADWFNFLPSKDVYIAQTRKHCRFYGMKLKDESLVLSRSKEYYLMRNLEKQSLKIEFDGYLFFSYAKPETQDTLPVFPSINTWTLKKGTSESPWFINESYEDYVARRSQKACSK